MIIEFLEYKFNVPLIPQYEDIRQTKNMLCQCGYSDYHINKFNLIGYCDTQQGFMAVFECEKCGEKYRHHINTIGRYNLKEFKDDLGLALYLINDK